MRQTLDIVSVFLFPLELVGIYSPSMSARSSTGIPSTSTGLRAKDIGGVVGAPHYIGSMFGLILLVDTTTANNWWWLKKFVKVIRLSSGLQRDVGERLN